MLASQLRSELDEVERALAKLDDGTYGKCETCGEAIASAAPRGHAGHPVLHPARVAVRWPRRRTWSGASSARCARAVPGRSAETWVEARLLPGRAGAVATRCPGPTAATRSGWPSGWSGRSGHEATRPVLAAALLHDVGQDRERPRHLRARGRHAVGQGRRRRDGRHLAQAARLRPQGGPLPPARPDRRRPPRAGRQRSAHRRVDAGAPPPGVRVDASTRPSPTPSRPPTTTD